LENLKRRDPVGRLVIILNIVTDQKMHCNGIDALVM
jgi:hypothetical protein